MKTAKICTPKLWQQISNYVNRQPIKTAKTCTPNRYAGFGTVVEDITESGYTKNQPILLGAF